MRTIVFFDRALKIDLNYLPALFNKGIRLEKLGNPEDAQELFDRAKQLDPTYKLFDGKLFDGAKQLEPQI